MNIWKSIVLLYTNNEQSKKEIKKTIPYIIVSKIIIYLGIDLTKEVKDLYTGNYKTLLKEIKDLSKWKSIPCSCNERINIVKMALFLKTTSRFSAIPVKIPITFCSFRNGKVDPKIHMKLHRTQNSQNNL